MLIQRDAYLLSYTLKAISLFINLFRLSSTALRRIFPIQTTPLYPKLVIIKIKS